MLVIAGAFAADTLGIGLAFNMATIAIIQFVAVPSAMAFSWLAYRTSTKAALSVALLAWIVIVLFGVALAPLTPTNHSDHDFQLDYDDRTNEYQIAAVPGGWDEDDRLQWQGSDWPLQPDNTLRSQEASDLPQAFMESPEFKYSLSFRDGPMNGQTALGPDHPSIIGSGPIGWWPSFMRSILWKPLGIDVGFQWLILGVLVGLIIGGSQALARSLFAQITPSTRSGEFFAFFRIHEPRLLRPGPNPLHPRHLPAGHQGCRDSHPHHHYRRRHTPPTGRRGRRRSRRPSRRIRPPLILTPAKNCLTLKPLLRRGDPCGRPPATAPAPQNPLPVIPAPTPVIPARGLPQ